MKKLILVIFTFFLIINAQNTWKNYFINSAFKDVVYDGQGFWCISSGGAFYYREADSSYATLNKAEGLSDQNLTSLAIDKYKRIWFGTSEGNINVYNPENQTFQIIRDIALTDKPSKGINHILIDDNTGYIVTDFGISLLDINKFTFGDTYRKFGSFNADSKNYYISKQNILYVCNETGLAVQKPGATNLLAPESWDTYTYNSAAFRKIIKTSDGFIIASDKGLLKFDGTKVSPYLFNGQNICDINVNDNKIFILLDNSLYYLNNAAPEKVLENFNNTFVKVNFDNNKNILISTDKNVIKLSASGLIKNYAPAGTNISTFSSICVTDNGALYSATGKDGNGIGVYELNKDTWKLYNTATDPAIPNNDYNFVSCSADKVFFLNWGRGVTVFENNKMTTYNAANSTLTGIPTDIEFVVTADAGVDTKGNIWVLNYWAADKKILSVKTPEGTWNEYEVGTPYTSQVMVTEKLIIDKNDDKWFTTSSPNGLYFYNNGGTLNSFSDDKWYNFSKEIPHPINCFTLDERNDIWVGTTNGIYYTNSTLKVSQVAYGPMLNKSINCMAVDALNRKWVGTAEGLFLLSSDAVTQIAVYNTSNSPLPSNEIKSIAISKNDGTVFIGTDKGLTSIKTKAVKPNQDFSELYTYPNPFVFGTNTPEILNIDGLVKESSIKIFNISGEMIREFESPGGKIAQWDLKNSNGKFVASGIYIIVAYDADGTKIGLTKTAIVR